jgi:hypothetical protein
MNKRNTGATRRLVVAEDSGRQCDERDRTRAERVLSAIARWVWPAPPATGEATPSIDAPPERWPDGELYWWWPGC